MNDLLSSALSVLLATNGPTQLSNLLAEAMCGTNAVNAAARSRTNDAPGLELVRLMIEDDLAQDEVEQWIADDEAANANVGKTNSPSVSSNPLPPLAVTLQGRIEQRFQKIRQGYEDFLSRYPNHAEGHLAFGSFLGDIGDEPMQVHHWEKSLALEPRNPAIWNNLAGIYAHHGPIEKAFDSFEKAIELSPKQSVYWHSYGNLIYLFRKDAQARWKIDEQAVFQKALLCYSNAMAIEPTNFILASDVAQTYYGIKPAPETSPEGKKLAELNLTEQALLAWTNAWNLSGGPTERDGVAIHFARWKIRQKRFQESREILAGITNEVYRAVRTRLERSLTEKEAESLK